MYLYMNLPAFADYFAKVLCKDRTKKVEAIVKYFDMKETLQRIEEKTNIKKLRDNDIRNLNELVLQYKNFRGNDDEKEYLEIKIYKIISMLE